MRFSRIPFVISALISLMVSLASAKPTLWIIGDSTVRNGTAGQKGWGDPLGAHFDPKKIKVVNRAIGGRSSRTFLTEGRWDAILPHLEADDYVLIQFGHNDGGEFFKGSRPRASIKGNGEETLEGVVELTGKHEVVHSFGWYLRKYATDTVAKGATPIILSAIPRNNWENGKIVRNDQSYGLWAAQAANSTNAVFLPFNDLVADAFEELGTQETARLFAGTDHTHNNQAGAESIAEILAGAIRKLEGSDLKDSLLPERLWLPSIFCDHMVLQRDLPVPIWGQASPNTAVTARINGSSATGKADANGQWKLTLPALSAGGPYELEIAASVSQTFTDVLVGEVWLCSGQSNMDFTVAPTEKRYFAGTRDWEKEVASAEHPQMRMFTAEWTMHESPQLDVEGAWQVCSPDTVGDFSAVAYFFGRGLQKELDVPIGLITCAYGASTAESWISEQTLSGHPQLKPLLDAFGKKRLAYRDNPAAFKKFGDALRKWNLDAAARRKAGEKPTRAPSHPDPVQDQHNPNVLYNGMIAPIVPYAIRGAIWYQGESNVGTRKLYPALQQTLIEDWHRHWNRDFPFYYVQLANYQAPKDEPAESSWASMREAQATSLTLANTGMAVTIDIGEEKDIHPRNKQDVGHRLSRLALAGTYKKNVVPCGPIFREQKIEKGNIRILFDHVNGGLIAKNGPLKAFAISGSDRNFVWAKASIDGDTVVVSSTKVPNPAYVRYAWSDNPAGANLYNSEMLPAAPLRTDP